MANKLILEEYLFDVEEKSVIDHIVNDFWRILGQTIDILILLVTH